MMDGGTMGALATGMPARGGMAPGASPQRPSLADRLRRRKMMGRGMPQAMPQGAPQGMPQAQPMPQAEAGMPPQVMKKGGETKAQHAAEMKKMTGTEAKLKKHASMPASKAHKGLKTGGVAMGQGGYKKGGSVPKSGILPDAESERGAKSYVKTKMDTTHQDKAKGPTGGVKMGAAGYNTGGVVMGQGGYKKGGATKSTTLRGGLLIQANP